jgi:hypothetical protein
LPECTPSCTTTRRMIRRLHARSQSAQPCASTVQQHGRARRTIGITVHVIPSCEGPSFCATDAFSHRANARLEPHIGNAEESVADFNREKSGDVAHVPGSYRFVPATYPSRRFFQETLLGSPAGFGFAWRAAEFECEESAFTRILPTRGLASATSSTSFASRSVRIHLRSFMPAMQFTLCARAIAGRVALMLLPAHALHAFCNLLMGR